jgi:hypothetical protein
VSLPASYLYGNGGTSFSWSPDGRWIAYTQNVPRGARNIFIVGSEGGSPVNVTQLNATHELPTGQQMASSSISSATVMARASIVCPCAKVRLGSMISTSSSNPPPIRSLSPST